MPRARCVDPEPSHELETVGEAAAGRLYRLRAASSLITPDIARRLKSKNRPSAHITDAAAHVFTHNSSPYETLLTGGSRRCHRPDRPIGKWDDRGGTHEGWNNRDLGNRCRPGGGMFRALSFTRPARRRMAGESLHHRDIGPPFQCGGHERAAKVMR